MPNAQPRSARIRKEIKAIKFGAIQILAGLKEVNLLPSLLPFGFKFCGFVPG
jgi:hypothetical protein